MPADQFPTDGLVPATVKSANYFNGCTSTRRHRRRSALLPQDLLDKHGISHPPRSTSSRRPARRSRPLSTILARVLRRPVQQVRGSDGELRRGRQLGRWHHPRRGRRAERRHPEATKGLACSPDWFADGTIPKGAITWQEEQGRQAFQERHVDLPPQLAADLPQAGGGRRLVEGRRSVRRRAAARLQRSGVSSLGGHNFAIAKNAKNKGTAAEFIKFMGSEEAQRAATLEGSLTPTLSSLYEDPETSPRRPVHACPAEVDRRRRAEAGRGGVQRRHARDPRCRLRALLGQQAPDAALDGLQTKLESIIQ